MSDAYPSRGRIDQNLLPRQHRLRTWNVWRVGLTRHRLPPCHLELESQVPRVHRKIAPIGEILQLDKWHICTNKSVFWFVGGYTDCCRLLQWEVGCQWVPSQNTKDSYQSCERVERLVALGERLVALGDADVVAIKDVDGPVACSLFL